MGLHKDDILLFSKHDDEKAFRRIFNFYYPRLFRFAHYIARSDLLAEEIVSDVFVKIWKNRKQLSAIERMDYYLFRSVKNQALNYLRQNSIPFDQIDKVPESSLMVAHDPEQIMLQGELKMKVKEAVGRLPARCRLIFEMSRDDGLKYEEIASVLDISRSTVKNQMTLALKKIKESLSGYIDTKFIVSRSMLLLLLSILESAF